MRPRANAHVRWISPDQSPVEMITGTLRETCAGHSVAVSVLRDGWVTVCDESGDSVRDHLVDVVRRLSTIDVCVAYSVLEDYEYSVLLAVDGQELSRLSSSPRFDYFDIDLRERWDARMRPDDGPDFEGAHKAADTWTELFGVQMDNGVWDLFTNMVKGGVSAWLWSLAAEHIFGIINHSAMWADFEGATKETFTITNL